MYVFTLKQIGERVREKKCKVYMSFQDLEKAYDRVNKEALWQVLRMYDVGVKLLNGIKSLYVNSLACVRVKGGESKCFRFNSGVRHGCIMYTWLFNVKMDAKGDDKEGENGYGEKGSEIPGEGEREEITCPLVCK